MSGRSVPEPLGLASGQNITPWSTHSGAGDSVTSLWPINVRKYPGNDEAKSCCELIEFAASAVCMLTITG